MLIDYKETICKELVIELPTSKSISNRALIIQALSEQPIALHHLSEAEDTKILQAQLRQKSLKKDAGMAGTVARFLSAFLATQKTTYILTAAERMQERPMKILFDALVQLGAKIEYLEKESYLPVRIDGSQIKGGQLSLDASVSSQFTSALMMIGPCLEGGLSIALEGKISSAPYLDMTAKIMRHFGIKLSQSAKMIQIPEQAYEGGHLSIEGDWSAASYFYSALALMDEGSLVLKNMSMDSWQGDSIVSDIYYRLGISTSRYGEDVLLEKTPHTVDYLEYDFSDCPDLAQSVICTCVGLGLEGSFSGLHTLRNKETDRIAALQNELLKFNWTLKESNEGVFELGRSNEMYRGPMEIKTYHDHRMAMAFAPLVIVDGAMEIEQAAVVEKSFPSFWEEIKKIGIF